MRLINTASLELEEFFDDNTPPYGILSHRWKTDEVSFQDMQNGIGNLKAGYTKIEWVCGEASRRGLEHVWVDTCCIDKTSSAELSEAINSMYRWYKEARICCVYLFDVEWKSQVHERSFRNASWWSRGWTLQELIAPPEVAFFDSSWGFLGTKASLKHEISEITSIDVKILSGKDPELCSIAERMSWASARTTTRMEDRAYCLLGLFGVNIPLLYGEGERAFIRLQEEIMKHSDDHSLFAWSFTGDGYRGLLARSPAEFNSLNIVVAKERVNRIPYSTTNMGLSIEFQMKPWAMDTYLVGLDCEYETGFHYRSRVGIFLRYLKDDNQMARVCFSGSSLCVVGRDLKEYIPKSIYVRQNVFRLPSEPIKRYGFWLRTLPTQIKIATGSQQADHVLTKVTCWNTWSSTERFLEISYGCHGTAGVLSYVSSKAECSVLKLGIDADFNPICHFGGPAWGPSAAEHIVDSNMDLPDRFILHSRWFETENEWVFGGKRVGGLRIVKSRTKVSILEGAFGGDTCWVVDIEQLDNGLSGQDPRHEGISCDGCWSMNIRGTRYKCEICDDFDYCQLCYPRAEFTHPKSHPFKAILKPGEVEDDKNSLQNVIADQTPEEREGLIQMRNKMGEILSTYAIQGSTSYEHEADRATGGKSDYS